MIDSNSDSILQELLAYSIEKAKEAFKHAQFYEKKNDWNLFNAWNSEGNAYVDMQKRILEKLE